MECYQFIVLCKLIMGELLHVQTVTTAVQTSCTYIVIELQCSDASSTYSLRLQFSNTVQSINLLRPKCPFNLDLKFCLYCVGFAK